MRADMWRGRDEKVLPLVKNDVASLEESAKAAAPIMGMHPALASAVTYCVMSASMILMNKYALSSFHFTSPNALLLAQCATSVVFVKASEALGYCKLEPLRRDIVTAWVPVNAVFVLMLVTGFFALQSLGVAMVTILKNLTNIITIVGDYFLFGRVYNRYVWLSLALIMLSGCTGAATDLAFSWQGYSWQIANCVFTAFYSLMMKGVMDRVNGTMMKPGCKMGNESMVYYNNLLSLPFIAALIVFFGEQRTLLADPALRNPLFLLAAAASCVVGFSISYATLWFLSTTTATTYSLVGSLNKIPVAIIGIIAFRAPVTHANLASIAVGLLAGVLFVRAKQMS